MLDLRVASFDILTKRVGLSKRRAGLRRWVPAGPWVVPAVERRGRLVRSSTPRVVWTAGEICSSGWARGTGSSPPGSSPAPLFAALV